tara:strand:- start:3565 stop:4335 length:771 start_codon:yes stop_codon:yes gene_type:complete
MPDVDILGEEVTDDVGDEVVGETLSNTTELAEQLTEMMKSPLSQIASRLDANDAIVEEIRNKLNAEPAEPQYAGSDGSNEFDRFVEDPNARMADVMRSVLASDLMPGLNATADAIFRNNIESEIEALQESHGPDAYGKIKDIVESGLNEIQAPEMRTDKRVVHTIFNAALGQDSVRSELADMESKQRTNKNEPTAMLGNGQAADGKSTKLTESDQRYLEETGKNPEIFKAMAKAAPSNISEYKAAMAAIEKKGGKK